MHVHKGEPKQVLLKSYGQISSLERAVNAINHSDIDKMSVSVLGNFGEDYSNKSMGLVNKSKYLQGFFKALLDAEFDSFYNPKIGRVFVTGFLVPMFLMQVGDKKLGELSGVPYGIFRGLGFSEVSATSFVKKLNDGKYLLLVRGNRLDIEKLEDILGRLEK